MVFLDVSALKGDSVNNRPEIDRLAVFTPSDADLLSYTSQNIRQYRFSSNERDVLRH
jgi:hypothetical protein